MGDRLRTAIHALVAVLFFASAVSWIRADALEVNRATEERHAACAALGGVLVRGARVSELCVQPIPVGRT